MSAMHRIQDRAREIKRLRLVNAELSELATLFAKTVEYYIKIDLAHGDDEGARLKTATLNRIRAALAKANPE